MEGNSHKKILFISLANRAVHRNLFFFPGSVWSRLKDYAREHNLKIIVIVEKKDANKYQTVLGEGLGDIFDIEVVKMPVVSGILGKSFYFFYSYLLYTNTTRILATMGMRPDEPPGGGRRLLALLKWGISKTFGKSKFVRRKLVRPLFYKIYRERYFKDLFDKYNPHTVFISHIYGWMDQHILAEAKRRQVKTLGMPAGWDHLDKYYLPFHPDKLIVQSPEVEEAAIKYQSYEKDEIVKVGYPHFDFMLDPKFTESRESVLEKIGFPKDCKYVLYVSGSAYAPDEPEIIEKILEWADKNEFEGSNLYMVIRPYPKNRGKDREFDEKKFKDLRNHPRIYFYEEEFWGDLDKSVHFVNIIRHSDVVLSIYNSVALEASAVDRPLLAPAFDGSHDRPLHRSIRRFEAFDHFRHMLDTGALASAYNFEELKDYLGKYLKDPSYRSSNREKVREIAMYKHDGHASERLMAEIEKTLNA